MHKFVGVLDNPHSPRGCALAPLGTRKTVKLYHEWDINIENVLMNNLTSLLRKHLVSGSTNITEAN